MKDTKNLIKAPTLWQCRILILSLVFFSFQGISQTKSTNTLDSLPLDSSVRYGRLSNGFTYYIKSLEKPQSQLHMSFYVKAGANQSETGEINVAHAVEHLAFKATKNFPDGIGQSDEIDKLKMTIYDMKATTSRRATKYHFNPPANNHNAVNIGLSYFRDIADGLLLNDEDIESVKGELRQEYLLKVKEPKELEADSRLTSRIFPCNHDYTNFLYQQANMDPSVVRAFYRDYYKPDLLAISVIGNVKNIDGLEAKIKETFSGLKNPDPQKMYKDCDSLYYNRSSQFHIVERGRDSSKIAPNRTVDIQMYYRDPQTFYHLFQSEGLQKVIMTDLLSRVLDWRFAEISSGSNSFNVLNENLYPNSILGGLLIKIEAKEGQAQEAFLKIQKGLVQLQKYGVSKEEFGDLKLNYLEQLNSVDENNSNYWLEQIFFHFIAGEALPEQKQSFKEQYINDLSLDDFNDFLSRFLSSAPQDIGVVAPGGSLALNWEENQVRSWIKDQQKSKVEAFSYDKAPEKLLIPEQRDRLESNIKYEVKQRAPKIKEYHLENGLRLVLQSVQPTSDSEKGKVILNGFSKRGICEVPAKMIHSALYAPEIVLASGVNKLDKDQVEQFIRDKGLFPGVVSFYVGNNESGMQAFGEVNQLETILQLLYLYITNPNISEASFDDWKENKLASARNLVINDFNEAINEKTGDSAIIEDFFGRKTLSGGSKMIRGINNVDIDESLEYFNYFFGNAKDFTLVVSGDFEIDAVLPVLIKYLGNLPAGNSSAFSCPSEKIVELPKGPKEYIVPTPVNAELRNVKYVGKFIKNAAKSDDWREQLKVEVLGKLTHMRAWDLRFKDGFAIYDVLLRGELNKELNRYEIVLYLDVTPKEFPFVRKEVYEVFEEMKNRLVSDDDLIKAIQSVNSKYYKLDGGPGSIQKRNEMLFKNYRHDEEIIEPKEIKKFLSSITPEDMRNFARQIYKDKYFYEFIMKENGL